MLEFVSHPVVVVGVGLAIVGAIWKFGVWFGAVNSDRDSLKEFMKEMRTELKGIHSELRRIFEKLPSPTVGSNSPVALTEFGKKVSEAVDAPQWAEEHASVLALETEGSEEFEVYNLCVKHVDTEFSSSQEFQRSVRAHAYQLGTGEKNVLEVYYVVLRDVVLEKHQSG